MRNRFRPIDRATIDPPVAHEDEGPLARSARIGRAGSRRVKWRLLSPTPSQESFGNTWGPSDNLDRPSFICVP